MGIQTTNISVLFDRIKELRRRKAIMKTRKTLHKDYVKTMTKSLSIAFALISMISCKHHNEEYHKVTDKIKAESKHYKGTSISSDQYLAEMNLIEITEGTHTFMIPDRKSQITSYACTECHTDDLEKIKGKDAKKGHWNISLKHANSDIMNCATCHDTKNMDALKTLTGNSVDFNLSYKVCSQCHSKQFEDWKGGAHGKKIESWAPPRASMTCTNCHNPHSPSFEPRWPAKYNTQKKQERK